MEKTWLITGGWGFIGTNLRERIAEDCPNDRVVVVDIKKHKPWFSDRSKAANVNVANFKAMDRVFMKYRPDYVVHLAAETSVVESMDRPRKCLERNIMGTLNCLDFARKYDCEFFVMGSSCGVVGESFCITDEMSKCDPESPYGASKLCSEKLVDCYVKLGLNACNLRFSNVYGPWSDHKDSVVIKFIKSFLNNEALKINGDGGQTRNFIYVKDVINSIFLALKKKAKGIYCVANNGSISVNDLVSIICEVGRGDAKIEFGDQIDGEIYDVNIDNSKVRRELMFQCEYSIVDGITETMKWIRQFKSGTL